MPARGASHIMKLLKNSRMFHILWCSSAYNYFIIFISILNVLNLASNKMLLFKFVIFCFMYYRAVISSGTEEGDEV